MSSMADDTTNDHSFSAITTSQDVNEQGQLASVTEIVHEAHDGSTNFSTLPMRHELISTAVTFLKDSRVSFHSIEEKKNFLLNKGLNLSEINLALNIASNGTTSNQLTQYNNGQGVQMYPPVLYNNNQYAHGSLYPTGLQMVTSLVPPLVIAYGTIYGLYMLYKKYIEPRLFGPPKKHPLYIIIDSVNKLQQSVDAIKLSLEKMEENIVTKLKEEVIKFDKISSMERLAASDLKKELSSLKALLLGRNNFPETPAIGSIGKKIQDSSSTIVTATIPSWQLASEDEKERQ